MLEVYIYIYIVFGLIVFYVVANHESDVQEMWLPRVHEQEVYRISPTRGEHHDGMFFLQHINSIATLFYEIFFYLSFYPYCYTCML